MTTFGKELAIPAIFFGVAIAIGWIKAKQLDNQIKEQRVIIEEYKKVVTGRK